MIRLLSALLFLILAGSTGAQEAEPPMTYERLGKIICALDPEAGPQGPGFLMVVGDVPVVVVTDVTSDRMRAMVSIRSAEGLTAEDLQRMMQANFDAVLDARYAIAAGQLWSVFIHPLAALEKDQFITGLANTVTAAETYGTLYSGGSMTYGGGDSQDLQLELLEDLLKKGEEI